jgi:hypothetical protein
LLTVRAGRAGNDNDAADGSTTLTAVLVKWPDATAR